MTQVRAYDYINERLKDTYFHGEWQLLWYEPNPYFELIIQTPLEKMMDEVYVNNQLVDLFEELENVYEFRILFYDGGRIDLQSRDALKSFPIHPSEGIRQGDVTAIIAYVKQLQASIKLKWHEFVTDLPIENFQVSWDQAAFEAIRKSMIEHHRYAADGLFFKEEKE